MKYKSTLRKLVKILFLDKYLERFLGRDLGVVKIKENYIVDIPKSGSSTIKHFVASSSKRYIFCKKFLNLQPKHACVSPLKEIKPINGEIKIFVFIRAPEDRLFSVYKQKVLNFQNFPSGYSLINQNNIFLKKKLKNSTKFCKNTSFLDFCNGIKNLDKEFKENGHNFNLFDKHIRPQYRIILNLKNYYSNFKKFKFIIYPINNINYILSSFLGEDINLKVNSTQNETINYIKDINSSKIIDHFYKDDKFLYKKLIDAKNGYLELTYESLTNFKNYLSK